MIGHLQNLVVHTILLVKHHVRVSALDQTREHRVRPINHPLVNGAKLLLITDHHNLLGIEDGLNDLDFLSLSCLIDDHSLEI